MISCGGCDTTWSGTRACHCGGCHETFAGLVLFDKHRTGSECSMPSGVEFREGMWRNPEMTEEQKLAAFGSRK